MSLPSTVIKVLCKHTDKIRNDVDQLAPPLSRFRPHVVVTSPAQTCTKCPYKIKIYLKIQPTLLKAGHCSVFIVNKVCAADFSTQSLDV